MRNYTECSITFWVNILGWQSNWDTFFQAGLGTAPWNSYIFGVLRNSGNSVVFTISDASSSSQGNYKSSDLTLNTWHHLGFTYKSGHCCIYVNGNLYKDYSTNIVPNFSSINYISLGQLGNASNYQTNCKMNDFRIYDHALSPLEVKEISKGLILHYPLNRGGWGQVNLVNNSDFSNLATTGTVIRDETVLFHGHPTCKISRTGATSNTYTGWSSQDLFSRLTPGTKVTVSVWVYRENTHGIDSGCEWRMYQRYNNGASTDWTGFYSASDWPIGEWKRFTRTYTIRSDVSGAFLNFNIVKNGTYWLAEPKVEIGEKATSWSPSVTDTLTTTMDLNSTIEYDCSGFCNNGTRIGTFTWTSDTPKYQVSTHAVGSSTTHLEGPPLPAEAKTVTLWIKGNKSTNGAIFNDKTSGLQIGLLNSLLYINSLAATAGFTTTHWKDGQWNHVVAINNNGTRSLYVNGQPEIQSGANNYYIHNADNFWLWNRSYNNTYAWTGDLSDFRIYVTALSADDVKSLYNNSAYIDNQGNIYGAVYEEV